LKKDTFSFSFRAFSLTNTLENCIQSIRVFKMSPTSLHSDDVTRNKRLRKEQLLQDVLVLPKNSVNGFSNSLELAFTPHPCPCAY
jgi:hypothetical protein